MTIDILFEDDDVILVNKPADLLTIPDRFDASKPSVAGYLQQRFGKIFIVHRLDRETSGIIIFAKNEDAHRHLSLQFEKKETEKIYTALLDGVMHLDTGEINKPIAQHSSVAGKMVVANRGKEALTLYRVLERFKHFTLVEADIKTGRTHQIRVHFQSIGYPLAVDALYGRRSEIFASQIKTGGFKFSKFDEERPLMKRTTLHARRLAFFHPTTGERMQFEAPLHKDFRALLNQLERWGK